MVSFLLAQIDSKVTVDMKEFLCFARAFGAFLSFPCARIWVVLCGY